MTNKTSNNIINLLETNLIDVECLEDYICCKIKEDEQILNIRPDKYSYLDFIKKDGGITNAKLFLLLLCQKDPINN